MAIPTYIGQINTFHSSNVTRALPGGTQIGDLAVMIGRSGNPANLDVTSGPNEAGWTEITLTPDRKNDGNTFGIDSGIRVYWRILASLSNVPIANNGGNVWTTVCIIRGFNGPPSAITCVAQNASSTAINFPNLNVGKDSLVVNYHGSASTSASVQFSTFANANLANVTLRAATANTSAHQIGLVTGELALPGLIGVGTAVLANANKQINLVMAFGDPPISGPPKGAAYTTNIRRRRRE